MHSHRIPTFVAALLTLSLAGCINAPEIRPDVNGIGDLDTQSVRTSKYDSAVALPRKGPSEPAPAYTVGPNDEMTIFVMGRDELGSQIPINAAGAFGQLRATVVQEGGNIVLPLLGSIQVAGRTVEDIRLLVERSYADRIASSNVDIILQDCRSQAVHVTGAVNQPATYFLCDDMRTLNDALSEAQWLSREAYPAGGVFVRNGRTYQLNYPLHDEQNRDLDILLQAGDSIHFPTIDDGVLPKVHVFGLVNTQGTFPMPAEGMTLLEALGLAEGPVFETSSVKDIYLMRTMAGQDMPTTYKVPLADLYAGPTIQLAEGDRIYVAPTNLARWDIWWRQAIPFTLTVRTINN